MTTIFKVPEEVLRNVFEKAYFEDLRQCQKVCRTWYLPAHLALLSKGISFWDIARIKKFIASIDYNPKESYLNAVKCIELMFVDSFKDQLDNDLFEKLFFRFQNLEKVIIGQGLSLFEDINNCERFLTACPNLKVFALLTYPVGARRYYDVAWNLRRVLTRLDISRTESLVTHGGMVQFISSFPRLNSFNGHTDYFYSFEELLPVFEHLANLTTIVMKTRQENVNFAERFLASKTDDIQDIIVQRLSQVLHLECRGQRQFYVDSIKFISKYLTGLDTFLLTVSDMNEAWTETQRQALRNYQMDIICAAKKRAVFNISSMPLTDLLLCLPTIMNKLFHQTSSTRRILEFRMMETCTEEFALIDIESDQFMRKVIIGISFDLSLHDFISDILDKIQPINNIDEFTLGIGHRDHPFNKQEVDTDTYEAILEKMPSLKKITLDVPVTYKDKDSTSRNTYALIENVTLRATVSATIQKLLDRCSFGCPNLKQLTLHYNCGSWNVDVGKFEIGLLGCTLEKLEIDVTAMLKMTAETFTSDFFTVMVDTSDERYVCKVPLDLSSISLINDNELNRFMLGKDYIQLYIAIGSLKCLEICGSNNFFNHDEEDEIYYLEDEDPSRCYIILNSSTR